jgi:PIN domain nuclease of toxin-antitoxin system
VKLLLDTHIVLWAAGQPEKLSESARTLLTTPGNVLFFSAASIWEIVIKRGLGREDFKVDPRRLRKMLIVHGYTELPVTCSCGRDVAFASQRPFRPLAGCPGPHGRDAVAHG